MRILFVLGTRPEAIKLAPLVIAMRHDARFLPIVCVTGQHREMLDPVLSLFRIRPRYSLATMVPGQTLAGSMSTILSRLDDVMHKESPGLTLVQGDTTSTLAGSLAAFYRHIPVGHVEAGLRTLDKGNPFPEEMNRKLTTHIADFHFAPTSGARDNLLAEGVSSRRIAVTGNTGVDALLQTRTSIETSIGKQNRFRKRFRFADSGRILVLVTAHRRESFGRGLRNICEAVRRIALAHPAVDLVYPVHLNPDVRIPVMESLSCIPNIHLLEPLDYESFVYLMTKSHLILTDSGGIQEEAPSLGKPILVMRARSERPENVCPGAARLIGTDSRSIEKHVSAMLGNDAISRGIIPRRNPFGDGRASERIIAAIGKWFSL